MNYRGDLNTEQQNKNSLNIDKMEVEEILHAINNEDASIADVVKSAIPQIEETVNHAVSSVKNGGRVFYVGAGTSGRLGVLDASEIPPTFSASIDNFIGYMNQTIYGIKLLSPYGTPNGSWCRANVTNCSPPGYMSACPSNPDQLGYLSVFKSSSNPSKLSRSS